MANYSNPGTFHPLRVNQFVNRMQYASDVNYNGGTRVNFGAVPAAAAANVLNVTNAALGSPADASGIIITVPYGRNLQVVGNVTMATTGITIRGYDYLIQPMAEAITMNGITPVLGLRAFKFLTSITWPAVAGGTFTVGFGSKLGLPYRCIGARLEASTGVPTATQGVLAAGPNVQPSAVAGQPDCRGTYTPFTTANNAFISAIFDFTNETFGVGAAEVCGLHGFPQPNF